MAKPILDLNTLIDRPCINIDGKSYELFQPDELSIMESHWFTARGQQITKAAEADDQNEVEQLVSEVAKRCLVNCPDEVFDALSGSHKMAISELFTRLLLQRKVRVAGAIAEMVMTDRKGGTEKDQTQKQKQTGAKSSPASSVSSAAILTGGSGAPQDLS